MDEELTSDFFGWRIFAILSIFKKQYCVQVLFLGKKFFGNVNFCFENHHNWLQHERVLKIF
jgi:hypothetical protein